MRIDFNKIDNTVIPNFRGGKKEVNFKTYSDDTAKIMYGKLESGASIGMHTHETNSEIIYILSGKGKVLYDDETEFLSEGIAHYCPKGHSHSLINDSDGDLIFFAVIPELE